MFFLAAFLPALRTNSPKKHSSIAIEGAARVPLAPMGSPITTPRWLRIFSKSAAAAAP